MEPLFDITLRHATDTKLTLGLDSNTDYLKVHSITPGRILRAYHEFAIKHRAPFIAQFPSFPNYEHYEVFVGSLNHSRAPRNIQEYIRESFSHMKTYLEWDELSRARAMTKPLQGAEIYFCAPEVDTSWFFKDYVESVDVRFPQMCP